MFSQQEAFSRYIINIRKAISFDTLARGRVTPDVCGFVWLQSRLCSVTYLARYSGRQFEVKSLRVQGRTQGLINFPRFVKRSKALPMFQRKLCLVVRYGTGKRSFWSGVLLYVGIHSSGVPNQSTTVYW